MHDSRSASYTSHRKSASLAFIAMVSGNTILSLGPWMVRLAQVGPAASAFWRVALAIPLLLLITSGSGQRLPRDPKLLAVLTIGGVFFALDLAAWHAGILMTKLANAALFGNAASFFFMAYGFITLRRLPNSQQWVSILLAMMGVGLLLGRSYELSPRYVMGDLLSVLAGLMYTGYLIAIERVRGQLRSWPALTVATIGALLPMLLIALWEGPIIPGHWMPLILLAIGSQVIGQGLMVYAIGNLSPVVIGLGLLMQPVIAAFIGWMRYGEQLDGLDIIGMIFVGMALLMVRAGNDRR